MNRPLVAIAAIAAAPALAQTLPPGMAMRTYVALPDPVNLSLSSDGFLFVGTDASGSGGQAKGLSDVWAVQTGGFPYAPLSHTQIRDPDALLFDESGAITGIPKATLVGGQLAGGSGHVSIIHPDHSLTTLWGPSTTFRDPNDFFFSTQNRLLIADNGQNGSTGAVFTFTPGVNAEPQLLFTASPPPNSLIADDFGRIYTTSVNQGVVRIYSSSGLLLNNNWVSLPPGSSAIARGPGNQWWSSNLFVITSSTGELIEIDFAANKTVRASGLPAGIRDLAFGPDGDLYLSSFNEDRILLITPCTSNCNSDTTLDFFDILCFLNKLTEGDPYADCDESSVLDLFDLLCYLNKFNTECPGF